jgi:hypothetical protein
MRQVASSLRNGAAAIELRLPSLLHEKKLAVECMPV